MINFILYSVMAAGVADVYKPETKQASAWLVPIFWPVGVPIILLLKVFK